MCDEWIDDYAKFKGWALRNGYSENLSVDRIDNDGNYTPANCKWSTPKEQANNRRNSIEDGNGLYESIPDYRFSRNGRTDLHRSSSKMYFRD